MKKPILLFSVLLLFATVVQANTQYIINDIRCYDSMYIQVNNVEGSSNYSFKNCIRESNMLWKCDCTLHPTLYNTLNETTILSFRIQYNIALPRQIINPNPTHPTSDEVYNNQFSTARR